MAAHLGPPPCPPPPPFSTSPPSPQIEVMWALCDSTAKSVGADAYHIYVLDENMEKLVHCEGANEECGDFCGTRAPETTGLPSNTEQQHQHSQQQQLHPTPQQLSPQHHHSPKQLSPRHHSPKPPSSPQHSCHQQQQHHPHQPHQQHLHQQPHRRKVLYHLAETTKNLTLEVGEGKTVPGYIAEKKKTVLLNDHSLKSIGSDPRFPLGVGVGGERAVSFLGQPILHADGQLIGVLTLLRYDRPIGSVSGSGAAVGGAGGGPAGAIGSRATSAWAESKPMTTILNVLTPEPSTKDSSPDPELPALREASPEMESAEATHCGLEQTRIET